MKRALIPAAFASLLCLGAATASAQQGFDKPPPPAEARPLVVPSMAQTRLPNGFGIAVAERRALPLATVLLQIDAGSLLDPPGKAGLASLATTVMGKGIQRGEQAVDAAEFAAQVEALGGTLDVSAGARASQFQLTVASNRLDEAVALLADVARRASLPSEELERSRAQALDALKLGLSDPGTVAGLLARRLFWGETPRGQLATAQSLQRIRRDDLLAFQRQQLRPDRAALVVAGDVDLAQARALAAKHFGDWKQNRMLAPQAPAIAPKAMTATVVLLDLPGAGQSAVVVAAPYAPLGNAPEQRAALVAGAVANGVLGVGYSSRINQEIRIKRGLSYGASSGAELLPAAGMLVASAQTKHESAGEVATLLQAELQRLAAEPVAPPELAARQALLIGEFGRELETTAGLAGVVADQLQRGRALDELGRLPDELQAVDAARVQDFATRFWGAPEAHRIAIVADLRTAGAALQKQFPKALVLRADELDLGSATLRRGVRR